MRLTRCLVYIVALLSLIYSRQIWAGDALSALLVGAGGTNAAAGQGIQPDEFSGSATYSVSIPVPPGLGGLEPQLALNYNSHRKNANGNVGYGWEMDLGSINRLPSKGVIDYYQGTSFEARFSGQMESLVFVGDNVDVSSYGITLGANESADLYRAQLEGAYNIYFHIQDKSDPNDIESQGWIVIDKSGIQYRFGVSSSGQDLAYEASAEGVTQLWIAAWYLEEVIDPNGNTLQITYVDNLIEEIIYDNITVEFDYDSLSIPYYPTFREFFGSREDFSQRLDQIIVKQDGNRIQRFNLTYQTATGSRFQLLTSVQQFGSSDDESLPATTFEYTPFDELAWADEHYDYQAQKSYTATVTQINEFGDEEEVEVTYDHTGVLNYDTLLADMNGDGLIDQVQSYLDSPNLYIYFNNGNDFIDRGTESIWPEPFEINCHEEDNCYGRVNSYKDKRQWVYLQDLNGDSLPDRFKAEELADDDDQADFVIAFNTGEGFSSEVVRWRDPFIGDDPGMTDSKKWFMDMNGDGLADRVASAHDEGGFDVYYNNGAGFQTDPVFWSDPISASGESDAQAAKGYLNAGDGTGTYADIRDVNGDGLPDRVFRAPKIYDYGVEVGTGIWVSLNRNGINWSDPCFSDGYDLCYDGINNLAILDLVEEHAGYLDSKHELIDFNGDGYLDRVEGDPDAGLFRVYFFWGTDYTGAYDYNYTTFSSVMEFSDPVGTFNSEGVGYVRKGDQNDKTGENFHTFIMDMNADGFPDRVTLSDGKYHFYPLRINEIEYSENPGDLDEVQVNQPPYLLTRMDNGVGGETAIEYLPSSKKQSATEPTHRFLPFNLWLAHKTYVRDYALQGLDASLEGSRHPGMRLTQYDYHGGNVFVRYAIPELDQSYFLQFNGFQEVKKTVSPGSAETWSSIETTTRYHQSKGIIDAIKDSEESFFDATGYTHYALSGKPYYQQVVSGGFARSTESSEWAINILDEDDNFNCNEACFPRLSTRTKTVIEEGEANSRVSKVAYEYGDFGNRTKDIYYDKSGAVVLEKVSEYYDPGSFASAPLIRDRPQKQTQGIGATIYRQKEFDYDAKGNPTVEKMLADGSGSYAITTRTFNSNGTLHTITDIDGVTKTIAYDDAGFFPEKEQVNLPTGETLTIEREFSELTGEPTTEISPQHVAKKKILDDFGRPIEEQVIDSADTPYTLKRIDYSYGDYTVNGWSTTLLKTQIYIPQDDYPETATTPAQITYSDAGGAVLQQCAYTERGNYRLVQYRSTNGGRTSLQTEPTFSENCDFLSDLSLTTARVVTLKDLEGRVISADTPDGDVGSPTGTITYFYSTNESGHLVKTATFSDGTTRVEEMDHNDKLIKVTDHYGSTLDYVYNPVGDLMSVSNGATVLNSISYDPLGRKTSMTDADMGTWTYVYDSSNNKLWKQIDAKGQVIENIYDSVGRLTHKKYYKSDASLEKYEVYTYDEGDADHVILAGELFQVDEYDVSNTLLRRTQFGNDSLFRRVIKTSREIPGLAEFEQTFDYNFRGQVTSTSFPGGETLYQKYSRTGSVEKICNNGSCDVATDTVYYSIDPSSGYNEVGALLQESYGNGVVADYQYYTNSHRLSSKKVSLDSNVYSLRNYSYDQKSNILSLTDGLGSQGSGAMTSIVYDSLSRLTSYQPVGAASPMGLEYDSRGNITKNTAGFGGDSYQYTSSKPHAVTQIGSRNYAYDENGNMTSDPDRQMIYNANNQLVKVTMTNGVIIDYDYDYTGMRVSKKVTREDPVHNTHEATTYYLGDALEIRGEQMIFYVNANNSRIATKSLGTLDEVMGGGGASLAMMGMNPSTRSLTLFPFASLLFTLFAIASFRPVSWRIPAWASYTHALNQALNHLHHRTVFKLASLVLVLLTLIHFPLHVMAGDTGTPPGETSDSKYFYYYHGDHLGSTHLLTEGNAAGGRHAGLFYNKGELIQRIEYAPFGQETFVLNHNLKTDPSYTGQMYDVESGLYYYKARYYNPQLARFIQADTVVPDATNLQAYNKYSYVMNNPLKYMDPSGHGFWSWFKKLFTAFIAAFIGAIITVLTAGTLGPILAAALGGMIAGAIGGAVSGGIRGALMGALLGGIAGALGGAAHLGLKDVVSTFGEIAILGGLGATLSYATGGWKALATFGAGFAGGMLGGLMGKAIAKGQQENANMTGNKSKVTRQDIDKYVDIKNGTPEEVSRIKGDLEEIFNTSRGKEMFQTIQNSGKQLEINLNNAGALNSPRPLGSLKINLDPNAHPVINTTMGPQAASTQRILAHEMGHAVMGVGDIGIASMDNVILNENPIMKNFEPYDRTTYYGP